MSKSRSLITAFLLGISVVLPACQTNTQKQVLETTESQVKLRSFQTRAFDTNDKNKVMRSVISTLQDLNFVVSNADIILGSVSGSKYGKSGYTPYELKMTVTVRPRGESQMLVRANAQYNIQAVEDPKPYQDFFVALEKSLFLTGQNVD
ncbi:MAG: hypothetical protein KDI88_17835 [Gammaproteobacteria bacterium]|nr:hypothetical protein [Gammaproteobacteria bacterium]